MGIFKKIKAKIYALIFWQTGLGEILNKINDLKIFYKFSFTEENLKDEINFKAYLTKQYHIVEKGMALPNPRYGFGKAKITTLVEKATTFQNRYGNKFPIPNIKSTLADYLQRNINIRTEDPAYYKLIFEYIAAAPQENGGVKSLMLSEMREYINIDFESFTKLRTSVRNFSDDKVTNQEVFQAVNIARNTPSVCNRQSWKVHSYTESVLKRKLLKMQNGNNGFTDSIHTLLIVTTDTKKFTRHESNQIFVDGGLFSMNLLLSLHSLGIGSCSLNTCFPFVIENEIKRIADISESERLVMMIGIGKYKEEFLVAISDKLPVDEILVMH